jgi:rubrerythrin
MPEAFNPQQILKIAARVKENGVRLFETLGRYARDGEFKVLWMSLRSEDEAHAKLFQEMAANVDDYIVYEMVAGEYNAYLRDIVPNYTYTQDLIGKKTRDLFNTTLEAVEFAIYIKIESILALSSLKEYMLPEKLDMLNKIIGDEKKFLARLTALKRQLQK